MHEMNQHKSIWLDKIFENSYIGVLIVDKQRKVLLVNPALCKMFGYEEDELLGKSTSIFHTTKKSYEKFARLAFESVIHGKSLSLDYQFKRKDGSSLWGRISGDIVAGEDEVLWTIIDITKRMEAENELLILKERMEFAIDGNRDIVWDWDILHQELYVSSKWKQILGYPQETPSPANVLQWKQYIPPREFIKISKIMKQSIEEKKEYLDFRYRLQSKEGNQLWIRMRGHLQYSPKGRILRMTGTHSDITQEVTLSLKNKQQAQIIEQIHDSVIATDLDGYITSWNYGSELLLGYKAKEVVGKHITMIYREEDYPSLGKNIEIVKRDEGHNVEVNLVKKSSEVINVELSLSLLKDEEDQLIGLVGYSRDITQRKKAEKNLQDSLYNLNKYLEVIDKIEIGLFVVDDDFTVRYMNNTMKKWFGNHTNKICYSSVAGLSEPCPYCKLHDVVVENKKVEYNPTTADGRSFEIVATSVINADGKTSKMEVIRDVTAQKQANDHLLRQKEELAYQAHHDSLTALPNRLLFNNHLEQSIIKAKRRVGKMALLFIDLDHFKEINDSLGHEMGDKVLGIVTQRLQQSVRKGDMLARFGGDEFAILMEDLHHGQDASVLAKKILEVLIKPIEIEDHVLYVTSSIGVSLYPEDGDSAQNLLKYADAAMYKAKSEGRNNFQFYSAEMTELAFERVVMEASLREALEHEDFVVYYQPQVDAQNSKIIGFEALVRWNHTSMGIVSPAKFLPLAESTGLIVELDRFVMKTAMKQLKLWKDRGYSAGKISLNLTVKQMRQEDFIDFLKEALGEIQLDAECVELELVENQIMSNPEDAIVLLKELNDLGIKIAIDDFGTGYSSLSYLKRLPIDKLKIDQSFIRALPDDEEDSAITKAVIALASSLKLNIIAEGVETLEQKNFLVENACSNIQGYLYSKPLPADEAEAILKDTEQFFSKIL